MASFLVTGGCGFIGRHLVAALRARGDDVTVLDNLSTGDREAIPADVTLIECSAAEGARVRAALEGTDGCFHLAGDPSVPRCLEDYLGSHLTNQTGTVAILDAAAREGAARGVRVPVVYASSCAVYGLPETAPLAEDAPTVPVSGYGVDKLAGEAHARIAADLLNVVSTGLRYFNVYGPGQSPDSPYAGVLSIFAGRLNRGQALTIHGDGSQVRDFVFVGDVVKRTMQAMDQALAAAGSTAEARILNVCTGRGTTVLEAAETLASLLDVAADITYERFRAGDVPVSLGDPTLAAQVLGALPPTTLADGLRKTLDHL